MKKHILHCIQIGVTALLLCLHLQAQNTSTAGREFLLSFGGNYIYYAIPSIRIVATEACKVTIETSDHYPGGKLSFSRELPANGVELINFTSAANSSPGGITSSNISHRQDERNVITHKSLRITANNADIRVYALNQRDNSTEATAVYPVETYGTEYFQLSYAPYRSFNDGFLVIANEDDTRIWINNVENPTALKRGQVYVRYANNDLTGTHIRANKPVAVFQANTGARVPEDIGGTETLYEQLVSVDKWGKKFVVPVTNRKEEKVKVVASEDNTQITINNGTTYNLQRGRSYEFENTNGAYIESNSPIAVGSFMIAGTDGGLGDPAYAWIPAIEQMIPEPLAIAAFPLSTNDEQHYAQLVVKYEYRNQTRVQQGNGSYQNITSGWIQRGDYAYQNYRLTSTSAVYRFVNPEGLLMWGYGVRPFESYHYLAGSGFKQLDNRMLINDMLSDEVHTKGIATCEGLWLEAVIQSTVNMNTTYLQWYIDDTEVIGQRNQARWQTGVLSEGSHTIRMRLVTFSGSVVEKEARLTILPNEFIWTGEAADHNWNNPDNWIITNGSKTLSVPEACSNVFIPGGLSSYPSLQPTILQAGTIKKDATCNQITLHYGGELAWPHKLTYNQAFVQYNVGFYNGSFAANTQPASDYYKTLYSTLLPNYNPPIIRRGREYYVSSPLKKAAVGDFSFAGYPNTITRYIGQVNHPELVNLAGNGMYYDFNHLGIPLEEMRNAVMIRVVSYHDSQIGRSDHKNLEGLRGIVQLPYFENTTVAPWYPHHQYDNVYKTSYFHYHDVNNLQLMYGQYDRIERGEEAYRFLFENASGTPRTITVGSENVPGYELIDRVGNKPGENGRIYLGNPFPASINSQRFFDANAQYLDPDYTIYSHGGNEQVNAYATSNNIPPYTAFGVSVKSQYRGTTIPWKFPLEGPYALTGSSFQGVMPLAMPGDVLAGVGHAESDQPGDFALLTALEEHPSLHPGEEDPLDDLYHEEALSLKSLAQDLHIHPQIFFFDPREDESASLRKIFQWKKEMETIGVAVRYPDEGAQIRMNFDGIEEFYEESGAPKVLLEDRWMKTFQDLLEDPLYIFKQRETTVAGNYTDRTRFVLHLSDTPPVANEQVTVPGISIFYANGHLWINSDHPIKQLSLYSLLGSQVEVRRNIPYTGTYSVPINLHPGIYIVIAHLPEGKQYVQKIVVR